MEFGSIRRIESLGLKDNDIVIIRVRGAIDDAQRERITNTWNEIFEHQGYKNIKVLVLNESIGIEVIAGRLDG